MLRINVENRMIIKQIRKPTAEVLIKLYKADESHESDIKIYDILICFYLVGKQQQKWRPFATNHTVIFY